MNRHLIWLDGPLTGMRLVARALCVRINVNCHLAAPCTHHGLTLVRTLREVCGWRARLGYAAPPLWRRSAARGRDRQGAVLPGEDRGGFIDRPRSCLCYDWAPEDQIALRSKTDDVTAVRFVNIGL